MASRWQKGINMIWFMKYFVYNLISGFQDLPCWMSRDSCDSCGNMYFVCTKQALRPGLSSMYREFSVCWTVEELWNECSELTWAVGTVSESRVRTQQGWALVGRPGWGKCWQSGPSVENRGSTGTERLKQSGVHLQQQTHIYIYLL